MRRIALLFALFSIAPFSFALAQAVPPADPGVPKDGYPTTAYVTCYAPGAGGSIEGPYATSRPNWSGKNIPCTLDDFRLDRNQCWYVTLAGNPGNYDKYYNMGTITYVSIIDNRTYIMTDVVGYVHDTGSAFRSPSCGNYSGMCAVMMRHFDIAYGDFRGGGNVGYVNGGKLCGGTDQAWKQVGGRVDLGTTVTPGDYVSGPPNAGPGAVPYTGSTPANTMRPTGSPLASVAPYQAQSSGTAASGASASSYGSASSQVPVSAQISPFSAISGAAPTPVQTIVPGGPAVASLYLQPRTVPRGGTLVISWTSLNMNPSRPCIVSFNGSQLAQGTEGSKSFPSASFPTGALTFALSCTTATSTHQLFDTITTL